MDIKIDGVTKRYGAQKAVDGISFEVKTGEILGFLGPNGAGKTTTMKMITNYIAISEGDITIGGKSVKQHADKLKGFIGYLPEHNPLYLDMPVMDYLAFCAQLQGMPKSKLNARIREMIELCGLDREKHKKIGELSKGYRQRVGLAQAMIHDPDILILDEPTTGLDPNQIVEIRKLIKELGRAKTVILSSHILQEVEATCDRILIIDKGRIVADGTAASLRSKSQGQEEVKVKIEDGQSADILAKLEALDSVQTATVEDADYFKVQSLAQQSSKRDIFQLCVEQGWVLTEMIPIETRLEDIFRNLTSN
ncbi:gliding motility-associated ABC transporter ATP-binding subunit GldA [marine bacterium AO1-C]|nr:gliding motility-associated ABC transporter ATP-binding subunit GldA [marine bacterium AO1-C]